jgi:hypothetical protein
MGRAIGIGSTLVVHDGSALALCGSLNVLGCSYPTRLLIEQNTHGGKGFFYAGRATEYHFAVAGHSSLYNQTPDDGPLYVCKLRNS